MNILNKRIIREIKDNFLRYLGLFFLIVLSISIVLGMASATDSVFYTVDKYNEQQNLEDGEFEVFVPYTDKQKEQINEFGAEIQENFYSDIAKGEDTIRVFKNRENINKITLDEGSLAKEANEIVIEKLYAKSHEITIGDSIEFDNLIFTVTGIGSVGDYSYIKKNPFDVASNVEVFSLGFVSGEGFDQIIKDYQVVYNYSYIIQGDINDKDLKDFLYDMNFDESMITNQYVKDKINEYEADKNELTDGLQDLVDGSRDLKDGMKEYTTRLEDIKTGTQNIANGLGVLNQNLGSYDASIEKLYKGSVELSQGTNELNTKGTKLKDAIDDIDEGFNKANDNINSFIDKNFNIDYVNLSYFLMRDENPRIGDIKSDSQINKFSALVAGVMILLIIGYMLAVFIIHNIEMESAVIGTLYALGFVKRDILKHYMILPMLLVAVSSILGTLLGYYIIPYMDEASSIYSFPNLIITLKPYAIIYGLILPILITAIVNCYVINKKLSLAPLQLLRKERKQSTIANVNLGNMSFVNRYRIRQILREIRGSITIIIGLFLAILLMVFAFDIKGSIDNYIEHSVDDAKFNFMYVLQYPEDDVPENGEGAYNKTLYSYLDIIDADMEVNLMGIKENSEYFDFDLNGDSNEVYISNSVAYKFGYDVGDKIILSDQIEDKSYSFNIAGIVPYSNGLYIFMDLNNMRSYFEQEDEYYNTVLSKDKLEIEEGRIAMLIEVEELATAASKFNDLMAGLIGMLLVVSVIVFVIVLYLLQKMMIDKATFSISLIKTFGFNEKEVKKLYLGSSLYTVLIATIIGLPVSIVLVNRIWPYMISNVTAGFESYLPMNFILIILAIIGVSYLIVNILISKYLKKVSLVEILKRRE